MQIYKNAIFIATLFAVASMSFSVYAGMSDSAVYQKAAFLALSGLSGAYLSMCLMMARRTKIIGGQPVIHPTVWVMAVLSVAMLGVGVVYLGVDTYADSVFEGMVVGMVGTATAVIGAFINSGQNESEE